MSCGVLDEVRKIAADIFYWCIYFWFSCLIDWPCRWTKCGTNRGFMENVKKKKIHTVMRVTICLFRVWGHRKATVPYLHRMDITDVHQMSVRQRSLSPPLYLVPHTVNTIPNVKVWKHNPLCSKNGVKQCHCTWGCWTVLEQNITRSALRLQ